MAFYSMFIFFLSFYFILEKGSVASIIAGLTFAILIGTYDTFDITKIRYPKYCILLKSLLKFVLKTGFSSNFRYWCIFELSSTPKTIDGTK